MTKILKVRIPGETDDVLRMSRTDAGVLIEFSDPIVRSAAERWISQGFIELIRDPEGGVDQRITKSDDAEFFDRIAASLRNQYGYTAHVASER